MELMTDGAPGTRRWVLLTAMALLGFVSSQQPLEAAECHSMFHGMRMEMPEGWLVTGSQEPDRLAWVSSFNPIDELCTAKASGQEAAAQLQLYTVTPMEFVPSLEAYAGKLTSADQAIQHKALGRTLVQPPHLVTLARGGRFVHVVERTADEGTVVSYHALRRGRIYTLTGVVPEGESRETRQPAFERAAATLELDPAGGPNERDELIKSAAVFFGLGSFARVVDVGEQALALDLEPSLRAAMLMSLGMSHLMLAIESRPPDSKLLHTALDYSHQSLAIQPKNWKALTTIAFVHARLGQFDQADQYFHQAKEHADPQSPFYEQLAAAHVDVQYLLQKGAHP